MCIVKNSLNASELNMQSKTQMETDYVTLTFSSRVANQTSMYANYEQLKQTFLNALPHLSVPVILHVENFNSDKQFSKNTYRSKINPQKKRRRLFCLFCKFRS